MSAHDAMGFAALTLIAAIVVCLAVGAVIDAIASREEK